MFFITSIIPNIHVVSKTNLVIPETILYSHKEVSVCQRRYGQGVLCN